MRNRFAIVGALLVVLGLAAAPALGADPKDGAFIWLHNGQYKVILQVKGNKVIPQYYGKCSPQPLTYKKDIKIDRKGKFDFDGTGTDALDRKVKINLKGKFVTSKKATGTIRATTTTCSAGSEDFVAKYQNNG